MVPQATNGLRVSVEELPAWSRKLVITVSAGRVRSERNKVIRRISKQVRRPGFRKGKAPASYVEKRYGGDIDRQTREQLIEKTFREALRAEELEPINAPKIGNVSYEPDSDFTFEIAFDIKPEIRPQRLGGFRLTRPDVRVADAEVDEELEALRRQHALWTPVERPPSAGDTVSVEITPLEDDAADESSRNSRPYRFVLGQGQAIPDVEAAIKTLNPAESGEFTVSFPGNFQDTEQRGKSQRLHIELEEVMEPELPVLDDEFARSVGEFESLSELREAVTEDRLQHKKREAEFHLEHQLVDQLIEANPFEIPESMVERGLSSMRIPPGGDAEALERARRETRPAVVREIKRSLILRRVAEEQGLASTAQEVGERLKELAQQAGRPVKELRALLSKSGDLRDIEWRITEEKVLRYLKEQSQIEGGS